MDLTLAIILFTLIAITIIFLFPDIIGLIAIFGLFTLMFLFPLIFIGCGTNQIAFNEDTNTTTFGKSQWKLPWQKSSVMPNTPDKIYHDITLTTYTSEGTPINFYFDMQNVKFNKVGFDKFQIHSQSDYNKVMNDLVIRIVSKHTSTWTNDYAHYTGTKLDDEIGQEIYDYIQNSDYHTLFKYTETPYDKRRLNMFLFSIAGSNELESPYTCIDYSGYCQGLTTATNIKKSN
jgi:hypothetical protein